MAAIKKGVPAKKSGKGMVPGKKITAALKEAIAGRRMAEDGMDGGKKVVGAKHGGMAKKAKGKK